MSAPPAGPTGGTRAPTPPAYLDTHPYVQAAHDKAMATQDSVRVTIFGTHMVVLPMSDPNRMDQVVGGAHFMGGWPGLERCRGRLAANLNTTRAQLAAQQAGSTAAPGARSAALARAQVESRALLVDQEPALRAWTEAMARLAPGIHDQLRQVEQRARIIAKARLDRSAEQIRREARRYLVGFSDDIFDNDELKFPTSTALASGTDVDELTKRLAELGAAQREADADQELAGLVAALAGAVSPSLGLATSLASLKDSLRNGMRVTAIRNRVTAGHPVMHRVVAPKSDPLAKAEILAAVTSALSSTWNAQRALRESLAAFVWRYPKPDHPKGPAAAIGELLKARGMSGGLRSIHHPRLGPWAFHEPVDAAVTDLFGPGPSAARKAVRDVYVAVDPALGEAFTEMGATLGALLALHLAAPPLAMVADVVLATKGVVEVFAQFLHDQDAYRCTLNPADSLALEPSVLKLALQCVGEVAGVLPGGKVATSVSILAPLTATFAP